MKGSELSLRKIVIIILCLIVTAFIILFLIQSVGPNFTDFISKEKKVYRECSAWAAYGYGEEYFTEDDYPNLYELYDGNAEEAKNFCLGKT